MVSIVPPSRGALVGKTYKDKAELKRKIQHNVIFFHIVETNKTMYCILIIILF